MGRISKTFPTTPSRISFEFLHANRSFRLCAPLLVLALFSVLLVFLCFSSSPRSSMKHISCSVSPSSPCAPSDPVGQLCEESLLGLDVLLDKCQSLHAPLSLDQHRSWHLLQTALISAKSSLATLPRIHPKSSSSSFSSSSSSSGSPPSQAAAAPSVDAAAGSDLFWI